MLQDDELRRQAADPDRLVEGEDPLAVDRATVVIAGPYSTPSA